MIERMGMGERSGQGDGAWVENKDWVEVGECRSANLNI